MKEIKLLMEHIEDELEDVHTYAELAVYEYLHKRDIERAENVGVVQGLYKR